MADPLPDDTRSIHEVKLGTLLALRDCAMGIKVQSESDYTLRDAEKYSVSTQRRVIEQPNLIKNPPPLDRVNIITLPPERLERFKQFCE